MKYCKQCVMPDTRPGIIFRDGICSPCLNYERRKHIDWTNRWEQLEQLADKYRGSNGDYYDCIITVSGGKDSHFQVHTMKEVLGMNPLLVSVDNISWTETGRMNWDNIRSHFGVDAHMISLNPQTCRKMFRKAFERLGAPTWYWDRALYAYPLQIAVKINIPFIINGENTNYERGGPIITETNDALLQMTNDVVKPVPLSEWVDNDLTMADLQPAIYPTVGEIENTKLRSIFLSYYLPWSSPENWKFAKSIGFKDLLDTGEWYREGLSQQFDQIDTVGYLTHTWLKFIKFGHWLTSDYLSIHIREGQMSREQAVIFVNAEEYKLDKKMLADFCDFCGYTEAEFWKIADQFANLDIVEKRDGVWRLKTPCY